MFGFIKKQKILSMLWDEVKFNQYMLDYWDTSLKHNTNPNLVEPYTKMKLEYQHKFEESMRLYKLLDKRPI